MIAGLNSDIRVGGISYHIQTEDWGFEKSCFVTQVFSGGRSIRQIKVMYEKVFGNNGAPSIAELEKALEVQHNKVLDFVQTRKL